MWNHYFIARLQSAFFLDTVLYRSDVLVLDIGSLLIFFGSAGLMLVFASHFRRKMIFALFLMLLCWKAIEISFALLDAGLFKQGIIQNHVGDLLAGMLGSVIGWRIASGINSRPPFGLFSAAGLACMISFLWVVTYGYQYNYTGLNSSPFNFLSFTAWSLGLCSIIALQRAMEVRISNVPGRLALIWSGYFAGLILVEFIGYELLGIQEVSKGVFHPPLLLGLIHGTVVMKFFYLVIGPVTALLDQRLREARLSIHRLRPGL